MDAEIIYGTLMSTNASLKDIADLLRELRPGRELSEEEQERIAAEIELREELMLRARNTRTAPTARERVISDLLDRRRAIRFRP